MSLFRSVCILDRRVCGPILGLDPWKEDAFLILVRDICWNYRMNHHQIESVNTRAFKESVTLNKDKWKGVDMSKWTDILWQCIDSTQGARVLFILYQHSGQSTNKNTSFQLKNLCYRSSLPLECFSPLANSPPAFRLTAELFFVPAAPDLKLGCTLTHVGSFKSLGCPSPPQRFACHWCRGVSGICLGPWDFFCC